jgi:hypothetical protein
MEIGARAVELQQMSDTRDANGNLVSPALHMTTGALDGRYQTKVGEGGPPDCYAEMAGSHDSDRPETRWPGGNGLSAPIKPDPGRYAVRPTEFGGVDTHWPYHADLGGPVDENLERRADGNLA